MYLFSRILLAALCGFQFVAPALWAFVRREVKRFWWRFVLDCEQPCVFMLDVLVVLVRKYDSFVVIVGD